MALPWLLNLARVVGFQRLGCRGKCYALCFEDFGSPEKVLEMKKKGVPKELDPGDVLVKMLASPINPADINSIQGTYGVKPTLPAVAGNEGVGEVIQTGSAVSNLTVGSWVVLEPGLGSWQTHLTCKENSLIEIRKDIPLLCAATVTVNPPTAYLLLNDFEKLQQGETVIQNGANSAVGQCVIQLARHHGLKTVNVVRDRPDLKILKQVLIDMGADYIVTEEEMRSQLMDDIFQSIPKPKLALNCVGGKNATYLARHLQHGGTMVTYGAMARQPILVPASSLIFQNVTFKGFWLTQWKKDNEGTTKQKDLISHMCELMKTKVVKPPLANFMRLDEYKEAIKEAMQDMTTRKQVLIIDEFAVKYL